MPILKSMRHRVSLPPAPAGLTRLTAHNPRVDDPSLGYSGDLVKFTGAESANLVTSATGVGDWHLPVLDLDVPHQLVPSSTPGHSHLYLDVPVRWEDYAELLRLLAKIGVLESGYADASIAKGATMVRKPGVTKPGFRVGDRVRTVKPVLTGADYPLFGTVTTSSWAVSPEVAVEADGGGLYYFAPDELQLVFAAPAAF